MSRKQIVIHVIGLAALLLAACGPQPTPLPTPSVTATQTPPVVIDTNTPEPLPVGVFIDSAVPLALREQVAGLKFPQNANIQLKVLNGESIGLSFQWVYALVAPFPTVTDGVTQDDLRAAWNGRSSTSVFNGSPLLMDESTLGAFTALWGEPADGAVRSVASASLLDATWSTSHSWAIIPFESIEPHWKVLTIDGQSPIRKGFDVTTYPLVMTFTLHATPEIDPASFTLPASNHDASKLTTVIMTGVTALVRATAVTMELKGATYPGEKMREVFREADIMHVSNEIPFFSGCPYPKPDPGALVFCSNPEYMDLLTDIGTDVIELTGNHFADYGPQAMYETIEIYRANEIPYYGGGQDLQDSFKPALFDVNGNKIAFIGCNRPDVGRFPTATDYQPGAAPCNFDYLTEQVRWLKSAGYVVISTFQWNESYDYQPAPQQRNEFRLMADAGASIVSGSQAHYAQLMEFYEGAFIHYGLGNLFFDQMGDQDWMPPGIRRLFFDRYVIYDGKLVSVELITGMLEDYSRPRLMNPEERAGFLQEYFYYSGWTGLMPTPTPVITPTLTPMSIPGAPSP